MTDQDKSLNLIDTERQHQNRRETDTRTFAYVDPSHDFKAIFKTSIAEGVAYFFVILCVFFSGGDQTKFIFGFWSVFMIFGNVSGAHVNPIVSVALWIYNGRLFEAKNIIKTGLYMTFQIVGGIIAAVFSYFVYRKKVAHVVPGIDDSNWEIFIVECFFSGTLVFVALFITCTGTRPTNKNYVNLSLISVWLYLIINAGADISGACYNPTIYLVLNGLAVITGNDDKAFNHFPIYFFAPFLGSVIFTLIFKYIFKPYYISKNRKVITEDDS